jgi:hypothetical protein
VTATPPNTIPVSPSTGTPQIMAPERR